MPSDTDAGGSEHRMKCRNCGEYFDMRSLTEVAIHEHNGTVPKSDIVGERVEDG